MRHITLSIIHNRDSRKGVAPLFSEIFLQKRRERECHIKISNRTQPLVTPHFEGLKKKNQPGVQQIYDHSNENGGTKHSETLQSMHSKIKE